MPQLDHLLHHALAESKLVKDNEAGAVTGAITGATIAILTVATGPIGLFVGGLLGACAGVGLSEGLKKLSK